MRTVLIGAGDTFGWFVVLPDSKGGQSVGEVVRDRATRVLDSPGGRPWLLGCWTDGDATTACAGRTALALIGQHGVTNEELAAAAQRIRTVHDVDRLAASLVGSCHLVASVDGQVRVQGTVTGVRRVFYTTVEGVPVAADRADTLAHLAGASFDEDRLALHLLHPHILYPLAGLPVWRGVNVLPGDSYLVLHGDRVRCVRWWVPPEPVLPMREGARALREALSDAVEARVAGFPLVSCDLGGLDSTAICSLAARGDSTVAAFTAASPDPLADDVRWAAKTIAGLPSVEHHVIAAEEMPLVFCVLSVNDHGFDEPFSASVDGERWLEIGRRAAERGSRLHLTGFGGDEVLYGSIAHMHDLMRRRPRTALDHLRGFAAKYRWPWRAVLRQLADRRPYEQWLRAVAGSLTAPRPSSSDPLLEWGFRPRMPPWASADAVGAVRVQIEAAAAKRCLEPLSRRRGQHRELEAMRYLSRMTRQFEQLAARLGITLTAPYYDDRVVEAGLAVRPEDRVTPWRYKPLIVEAMRGIAPSESLTRQTKANGSGDEEPGLRRHRAELLALWEDSRLDRLGLVDGAAVRKACVGALPPHLQFGVLDQVVACELWLRSLERSAGGAAADRRSYA